MNETSLFSVFISNFLGYDFIIFVLAGINIFFLIKTSMYSKQLFNFLNPQGWVPGGEKSFEDIKKHYVKQKENELNMIYLRRKSATYYSFFENVTSIFPLLGILGTVVSLLPMVNMIGSTTNALFFSALTSTFWGVVFAVIFKGFNGYLSAQIEDNEKNIATYLERNSVSEKNVEYIE